MEPVAESILTNRDFASAISSAVERRCRGLHAILKGAVLLIAGSNLLAWLFGLGTLRQVVLMRFNASLALAACGVSLWLSRDEKANPRKKAIARGLAVLAALIGLLTALQYLTGRDLHIDQLFKAQPQDVAGRSPRILAE